MRLLGTVEPWKAREDKLLRASIAKHGTNWKHILPHFPSRSMSSVRNRWQRILNEVHRENRCRTCGMPRKGHLCVVPPEEERTHADKGKAQSVALEMGFDFLTEGEEGPAPTRGGKSRRRPSEASGSDESTRRAPPPGAKWEARTAA